jgi:hypothetical protein
MCDTGIGYRWLKGLILAGSGVTAALPLNGFVSCAANEKPREERHTKDRDESVGEGEVRANGPVVEAPAGAEPHQENSSPLPEYESGQQEGDGWQKEEEEKLQRSHGSEEEWAREEECEVLGPTLDHLRCAGIHASGEGFRRIAEANVVIGALDRPGEGDIFKDLLPDQAMSPEIEIDVASDEQKLAVGSGERRGRIADLLRRINGGKF